MLLTAVDAAFTDKATKDKLKQLLCKSNSIDQFDKEKNIDFPIMISNDWKPVFFILSIANITYLLFGFTRVAVPQLGLDLPLKWTAVNQRQLQSV